MENRYSESQMYDESIASKQTFHEEHRHEGSEIEHGTL